MFLFAPMGRWGGGRQVSLTSLSVANDDMITVEGVESLVRLRALATLDVSGCKVKMQETERTRKKATPPESGVLVEQFPRTRIESER